MMLVPVILFLAGSLSSAIVGPHARLKSSKNWAKKARFLEVVSSESSPPSSSTAFNPVAAATKPNIFDSLTDDEARLSLTGDSTIEMVDLVQPSETGKRHSFFVQIALPYLDNGGPAPDRFAVARIAFGATEEHTQASIGYHERERQNSQYNADSQNCAKDEDLLAQWNLDVTATATGSDNDDFDVWGETLLPQGLFFKSDITAGIRPIGWVYGDIFYPTTEKFREAWNSPDFVKYKLNLPGSWIGSDRAGDLLPGDNIVPLLAIQPSVTFTRDTGVRLFDIKRKRDRIIYDLGLQEAVAHYAGNDPVQSGTANLDTRYGFGLLPGYDCPAYSHFLNTTFHAVEISTTHRTNVMPDIRSEDTRWLTLHTSKYLALTKKIVFTLRSVSTVGTSIFWNFREWFVNSFVPKVDMDILGTDNTFMKPRIVPAQVKYPWANKTRPTMRLVRERVENEDQAKLFWPQNGADMFLVENSDMLNKYGEPRGYRIAPSRGGAGMRLTIENSSDLIKSQAFATHSLYITKQKDTEVRATRPNNDYDPGKYLLFGSIELRSGNPLAQELFIGFLSGLIPDESLNQTDIVVSACIMYHTQEIYQTLFTSAQSAFIISPRRILLFPANFIFITEFSDNYLLNDASRATGQMVRVDYNSSGVQLVKNFGGEMPSGLANLTAMQPNLFDYAGDVAVRKFGLQHIPVFRNLKSQFLVDLVVLRVTYIPLQGLVLWDYIGLRLHIYYFFNETTRFFSSPLLSCSQSAALGSAFSFQSPTSIYKLICLKAPLLLLKWFLPCRLRKAVNLVAGCAVKCRAH
ncbi:copper amine oxidase [Mycena olivaceomarginata]|nr:copper amine oxidase [Mycena olivaceomarginata]